MSARAYLSHFPAGGDLSVLEGIRPTALRSFFFLLELEENDVLFYIGNKNVEYNSTKYAHKTINNIDINKVIRS